MFALHPCRHRAFFKTCSLATSFEEECRYQAPAAVNQQGVVPVCVMWVRVSPFVDIQNSVVLFFHVGSSLE